MIVSNKNTNLSIKEEIFSKIVKTTDKIKEFVMNVEQYHDCIQKTFILNPTERFIQVLGSAYTKKTVKKGSGVGLDEDYLVTRIEPHFIGTCFTLIPSF